MTDRSFLKANLDELIEKLSLEEKAALIAGKDFWRTAAVERLGIPSIKVTDGPNGARGGAFLKMTPALCMPCGSALGCTFDPDLVKEVGQVLAEETKARAAVVLLGPTLNIARSPTGGRAFESFSEDPVLSGYLTAAYINGLQSKGIAATPKHFVCNDQEHERDAANANLSLRTLREVYLLAFQIALAHSDPWSLMTSYGKVYGTHVAESQFLLKDVLRTEFGRDNLLVMSDWYGTYSTSAAINAGLSLEMPGATRWRSTTLIQRSLSARTITEATLQTRVKEVLQLVQKLAQKNPDIVYGEDKEVTLDNKEHQAVARKAATQAIVLLKNDKQSLPIKAEKVKSIAILGGSAKMRHYCGGGSAELGASYRTSPYEGITKHLPKGISVDYAVGSWSHNGLPTITSGLKQTSGSNAPGMTLSFYRENSDGSRGKEAVAVVDLPDTLARILDSVPGDLERPFQAEATATYTADIDGAVMFGVIVAGRARLYIDDTEVVDAWTRQRPGGGSFFGAGAKEERGEIVLKKGQEYAFRLVFSSEKPANSGSSPFDGGAFVVGSYPVLDMETELQKAVDIAASVDVPIIVTGLSAELESEGWDRSDLTLPQGANDLVHRVAKANPNTVVIVQSGSAILMPWADEVSTLVWAPYGGNEGGNAIGEIVCGLVAPSGRLSMTFPKRDEDVPAFLSFRSEDGLINYDEGIYVGYKWYEARKIQPAFAFGHGLSYSTFEYSDLSVNVEEGSADFKAKAQVKVTNSGSVESSVSVLLYLSPPKRIDPAGLSHPISTLRAFKHVQELAPGASTTVHFDLGKYAICHYSQVNKHFTNEIGEWTARIGASALVDDTVISTTFTVDKKRNWTGL